MEKATVSLTRLPRKLGRWEQYLDHLESVAIHRLI